MSDADDFEPLRARIFLQEGHAEVEKRMREFAQVNRWVLWDTRVSGCDGNACYCACSIGGPCEHKWDGQWWNSEDGTTQSATCSRCGISAILHDMRVLP